ncbi:MAG TPA: flagellar assembly protein FliW, partial [Polyangiaceae bacterium]|nr:flagellar assembly protein FliW [Polyangiaceae bacterium]
QRFGALEVGEDQLVDFPEGVVGFPQERRFFLVPHNSTGFLAWLHSATTPGLALPVVSAHAFGSRYPDVDLVQAAAAAGLGDDIEQLAVMVVLCAPPGQPATVNLLAPIVINVATNRGAQVILEGSRFTTRELFVREVEAAAPKAQAAAE